MQTNLAIQIENLKFQYPGQSQVILDINKLEILKNSSTFLQGPSGSGKSTLLNIIGGVLPIETGTVEILGENFGQLSASKKDQFRADKMGFIFQMFNLVPYLNVQDNILLPLNFSTLKRQVVLSNKNSSDTEDLLLLMEGLKIPKSFLTKKVTELSVGQQQRVAAARALIGKPEIIIADEPTSSLDYDARDAFLRVLFDQVQKNKSTLIFVSHDTSLKQYFQNFIELKAINKAYLEVEL